MVKRIEQLGVGRSEWLTRGGPGFEIRGWIAQVERER